MAAGVQFRIQMRIIAVDAGEQLANGDAEFAQNHGRAAVYPLVEVSCCNALVGCFSLNAPRNVNMACTACRQDIRFECDGRGGATVTRDLQN